jgi:hypothetical protein
LAENGSEGDSGQHYLNRDERNKMRKTSLISIVFVFLLSSMACLPPNPLSAAVLDIPTIDAETLRHELYHGPPMVLANALSPIEFKDLTIRGSVNIPASRVAGNPNLPAKTNTLLVFFCKSPG